MQVLEAVCALYADMAASPVPDVTTITRRELDIFAEYLTHKPIATEAVKLDANA